MNPQEYSQADIDRVRSALNEASNSEYPALVDEVRAIGSQRGTLSDWERAFCRDVRGRASRGLSSKQIGILRRILTTAEKSEERRAAVVAKAASGDAPMHEKILAAIDPNSPDLSGWEKRFVRDMIGRVQRNWSMSPRQIEIIEQIPARMAAASKARQEKAERDALKQQITTEVGFERVVELLRGALENGLQRPAITFAVTNEEGEAIGRNCVFRTLAKQPDIIEVTSRAKRDKHTEVFGVINTAEGTFTYNGLCPDEIVRFVRYVAEDPEAAAVENGMLSGNCVFCASGLTDHRSTAVGYGPICAKSYNLPWSEEVYRQRLALRVAKMQSVRSVRDIKQEDETMTTDVITCGGCNKFALHPVDYDREIRNDTAPETWACRNGCEGHGPFFDEADEKCDARFVVSTSDFLKGRYEQAAGVSDVSDVARTVTKISKPEDAPVAAPAPAGGRTWDCTCGKSYRSHTGRYNHLKKAGEGCGKAN